MLYLCEEHTALCCSFCFCFCFFYINCIDYHANVGFCSYHCCLAACWGMLAVFFNAFYLVFDIHFVPVGLPYTCFVFPCIWHTSLVSLLFLGLLYAFLFWFILYLLSSSVLLWFCVYYQIVIVDYMFIFQMKFYLCIYWPDLYCTTLLSGCSICNCVNWVLEPSWNYGCCECPTGVWLIVRFTYNEKCDFLFLLFCFFVVFFFLLCVVSSMFTFFVFIAYRVFFFRVFFLIHMSNIGIYGT